MSIRSLQSKVRQKRAVLWLVAGGVAVTVAAGCSSDFSSCEDSKTCANAAGTAGVGAAGDAQAGAPDATGGTSVGGSAIGVGGNADAGARSDTAGAPGAAGEAGEPGAAGAAGGGPLPECVLAADCDDHIACNGTESCLLGVCKPGAPPCVNPDAAHCDVICTEGATAAVCTVQGQDKDHDTYLSKLCAAKPGTDCDDAVATTHPGAAELCDRVDNDCDGKIDTADGLIVSGKSEPIGAAASATRATPAIAWATDKSVYGVVWYDGSSSTLGDVYFETFNQGGVTQVAPELLNTAKAGSSLGLGLTWGGDSFGATWIQGQAIDFREISSAGTLAGNPIPVASLDFSTEPKVARIVGGDWAVVWGAFAGGGIPNSVYFNTVTSAGVPGTFSPIASGSDIGLAATATSYIQIDDLGGMAKGLRLTPLAATVGIALTGKLPVVASGSKGYAIAVSPSAAGSPQFYAFGPTGTALCGPVSIADATFVPAAIVATPTGYLVVSSGGVRVQEVFANCTLGQLFTVDAGPATDVTIAGSAAGYGIVWQDATAAVPKRHLFGPNFCN